MTLLEITNRLKEIEQEMESEDLFDDLEHPHEVMQSLVYLCKETLKLLNIN